MLVLDAIVRECEWKAAGITLGISPLPENVDQRFIQETTKQFTDAAGRVIRAERDTATYAQKVGNHCIKSWTGVVNNQGDPVTLTPEAVDQFMLIEPAQQFVFARVKSLKMYLYEETQAAGNA